MGSILSCVVLFLLVIQRAVTEELLIGPVEGGIVTVTGIGSGLVGAYTGLQQLSGGEQTPCAHIIPNGSACVIAEDPIDLRLAHKEGIAKLLRALQLCKVFIDVGNDLCGNQILSFFLHRIGFY